ATFFSTFSSLLLHYSRIAMGEIFILFFFLFSLFLWVRSKNFSEKKKRIYCIGSGFAFGLSILFKISAMINFPIMVILFLFQWKRREIRAIDISMFLVGLLFTLPPWGLINYFTSGNMWNLISTNIELNYSNFKRGIPIIFNLLNIQLYLTNLLMGTHPVLWIIFLVYFLWFINRIVIKEERITEWNPIEIVAIAILLGGSLATFWLSYQTEQRILPFLWAWSIAGSLFLTSHSNFRLDLEKLYNIIKKKKIGKFLWVSVSVFPLWLFMIYGGSGITERMPIFFGERPGIGFLGLSVLCSPLLLMGVLFSIRHQRVYKALFWGSIISLVLLGLNRLAFNLQLYFGIDEVDQFLRIDLRYKLISFFEFPVLLIFLLFSSRVMRIELWKNSPPKLLFIAALYLLFHFWQGILPIIQPTYSVKELAERLSKDFQIKRLFLTSFHTPTILINGYIMTVNKFPQQSFNINRYYRCMEEKDTFAYNLSDLIPRERTPNIFYLNSWDNKFPLPREKKLMGNFNVCPFGYPIRHHYVFSLWKIF
ncbi:MAG: hypothetical protein C0407_01490, partial [Desulfobacca sp.]|nr:hypothetical protein [Desulfobacca sp.]